MGNGTSIVIKGIGAYGPEKRLTNDDLSKMVDTSDEWIVTRTGIRERRIVAEGETSASMGTRAAEQALERAGVKKEDIDLLIVGTMTPDMLSPSTACIVQAKLGIPGIMAFDVEAACSGFLYGLEVGSKMMQSGNYKNALIIGTETMSSILDWEDRSTCVLFGDGAGAAVLSHSEEPGYGIIESVLAADGSKAELLYQPGGGCLAPISEESVKNKDHLLKMSGPAIFKQAVKLMEGATKTLLERTGVSLDEINCVIPHQANIRIIESLSGRLGVPMNRFVINLDKFGNTSAASIPLALNKAYEAQSIKSGDLILLTAFGAGLTWGATLIRWQ